MNKLHEQIGKVINEFLQQEYGFTSSKTYPMAQRIITLMNDNYGNEAENNFRNIQIKWFRTTKLNDSPRLHSSYGFATTLDKRYHAILFPKWRKRNKYKYLLIRLLQRLIN